MPGRYQDRRLADVAAAAGAAFGAENATAVQPADRSHPLRYAAVVLGILATLALCLLYR